MVLPAVLTLLRVSVKAPPETYGPTDPDSQVLSQHPPEGGGEGGGGGETISWIFLSSYHGALGNSNKLFKHFFTFQGRFLFARSLLVFLFSWKMFFGYIDFLLTVFLVIPYVVMDTAVCPSETFWGGLCLTQSQPRATVLNP